MRRAVLSAVTAAAWAALSAGTASGRTQQTLHYPLDDVYSTAVRFLRIDRGCSITDRDPQAAYVLFECKEGKQVRRGALELYRLDGGGVRVQLSLQDEPAYMEPRMIELLGKKLREERGAPRPPAPPAPSPGPPGAAQPARPDGGSR